MTASTTSATTGSTFYSACALDGRSAQQLSHLREGEGGVAGFAKGGAKVSLSDKDGGTLLTYDVEAQIGSCAARHPRRHRAKSTFRFRQSSRRTFVGRTEKINVPRLQP
jgi:hypothetical protein